MVKKISKKKESNSQKVRKIGIGIVILLLAIGFATVTTTLYINGSSIVKPNNSDFVKGLVFDKDSITTTGVKSYEIVDDGNAINITLDEMDAIDDEATLNYKLRNDSQYVAEVSLVECYFVDDFESGKTTEPRVYTNDYIQIAPSQDIVNAKIQPNGTLSGNATIYAKQIKSYTGGSNNIDTDGDGVLDAMEIKFQCRIVANAIEYTK